MTPVAAGVVTMLHTSAKNSVRELIDYTTYNTTASLFTTQANNW